MLPDDLRNAIVQMGTMMSVVCLWRVVWKSLDIVAPMDWYAHGGPLRCIVEGLCCVGVSVAFLFYAKQLPREW